MKKRYVVLILALLLFGAAKLPFDLHLEKEYRAAGFHAGDVNIGVRAAVGEMGFVAALSGFRSAVADLIWIRAYVAWTHTEWGRMKLLFDACTALQPRAIIFWDMSGYHMGWNASVAARQDPAQPIEALRIKAQREYFLLGEDFYLRGIAHNPDSAKLYDGIGRLYADKLLDHCKAAKAFAEAAKRPDAMPYVHRIAAYELARCPGHEAEAYKLLREFYDRGKSERLPTLLKLLDELQHTLNVPPAERIDISPDLREATPR